MDVLLVAPPLTCCLRLCLQSDTEAEGIRAFQPSLRFDVLERLEQVRGRRRRDIVCHSV